MYSLHQCNKSYYKDKPKAYNFHVDTSSYCAKQFFVDAKFLLPFLSKTTIINYDELPFQENL